MDNSPAGISSTEIAIHLSATHGRSACSDIQLAVQARGWLSGQHVSHLQGLKLPTPFYKPDLICVKNGGFPWSIPSVDLPNGQQVHGHALEIKVCRTSEGKHKNCITPFKVALGAGMSHFKRGYWPYFLYIDLVDVEKYPLQAPHIHGKLVDELQDLGVPTMVMTRMPNQTECKSLAWWLTTNPLLLPGVKPPPALRSI